MWADVIKAVGWVFLPTLIIPVIYLLAPKPWLRDLTSALIRSIDSTIFALGEIVKWALPVLVISVAASVFALSIFGTTTVKWLESALYLQAVIITLGAAATLLAGQHVRVDIFHERMGTVARARVDLVGFYLLLAPVCLLIIWNSQTFVGFAWMTLEGSTESNGIRGVFLLKTLIPIFAISLIMQGLAIALRAAMALNGEDRPPRPKGVAPFFQVTREDTL
ncbi:C4-dicarboxylate ABC transporter substrate-binding protein [Algimonas arctica]|uniref:TRAP transporter small permease protein n=1 Tax=Algimonas arctica TaxID=1479486 RepID=A0A8J3G186_9PROT|nr:TRAP transporter small permease subunit [Algimonas arctica]GHA83672.1 C4-dicarboxylate ABC transporter substrate-binding protein [Algimonas arctica]